MNEVSSMAVPYIGPPPPPPPLSSPTLKSQAGTSQGLVGVAEADSSEMDVFGMDMTYEHKVNRVISIMSVQDKFKDLQWQPTKGKAKCVSSSMGEDAEAKDIVGLPTAPGFVMEQFDDFMAELATLEKSRGKPNGGFDGGPYPARPKFHANSYRLNDPPWSERFLASPVQLLGTPLIPARQDTSSMVELLPIYSVAPERLHGWEASNRETLAMLTYTDWFVAAVRTMLVDMGDRLAKKDVSVAALDGLVVDALEGVQILESAGRGMKDLAQATVHRLCAQTLTRRDAWLKKMTQDCPREEKVQMRMSGMNIPQLFSQELLEKAQGALERNKADQVHNSVLQAHAENRPMQEESRRRDRRPARWGSQDRQQGSFTEDRSQDRWKQERESSVNRGGSDYTRHGPPKAGSGGGSSRESDNNNNNYTYY